MWLERFLDVFLDNLPGTYENGKDSCTGWEGCIKGGS